MRRTFVFLAGILLLGCETMPRRDVTFEPSHVLNMHEVVLDDGRRIPVPPPIAWDTHSDVFQKRARVGNITQLTDTDKQGRKIVGDFFCVYQKRGDARLYADLQHAVRYRTDGTRESETYYDSNGSPLKWICYSDDGTHEALVVKQRYIEEKDKTYLQWVAVPDAKGKMQAYVLIEGESDMGASLHLGGWLDVNEPL